MSPPGKEKSSEVSHGKIHLPIQEYEYKRQDRGVSECDIQVPMSRVTLRQAPVKGRLRTHTYAIFKRVQAAIYRFTVYVFSQWISECSLCSPPTE